MDSLHIKKAKERATHAPDALAAPLQPLPPPDEGFTTWRPGVGAPPAIAPAPILPQVSASDGGSEAVAGGGLSDVARPAPPLVPVAPVSSRSAAAHALDDDPLAEFFYRPDEESPAVPAFAAELAAVAPSPVGSAALEEYLTFLLGAEEYAVAIVRIREVLKAPPITEVPGAPAHILGVVLVRGEVVAVVDPRRRLGLPYPLPAEGRGRIVIVDPGDGPSGLLVDDVSHVVRLPPGSIEPCPQGIAGARAEFLSGIGRDRDRLFTVLDLEAVLRRDVPQRDAAAREAAHGGE